MQVVGLPQETFPRCTLKFGHPLFVQIPKYLLEISLHVVFDTSKAFDEICLLAHLVIKQNV